MSIVTSGTLAHPAVGAAIKDIERMLGGPLNWYALNACAFRSFPSSGSARRIETGFLSLRAIEAKHGVLIRFTREEIDQTTVANQRKLVMYKHQLAVELPDGSEVRDQRIQEGKALP